MKNKKALLVGLSVIGAIVALVILFGVLFGVQTAAVFYLKKTQGEYPELYVLPYRLEVPSELKFAGRKLSFFGYDFEAPWTDVEKEDTRQSFARILFKSGKAIVVFNPAEGVDLVDEFMEKNPEYADNMVSVFGHETMKSNYSLYKAILNATPNELSIFMPKKDVVRLSILLILKPMLLVNAESGLYSFEYQDLRGFQFGNPARTSKVMVHIFDKDDRKVELLIFAPKDSATTLSQDEIIHLIQTLRTASLGQGRS